MSKWSMIGTIYPTRFIGTAEIADEFLQILDSCNVTPIKIGLHEPVRECYTKELAIKMWTKTGRFENIISGGLMLKTENPSYLFNVIWFKGKDVRLTDFTMYTTHKDFHKFHGTFEKVYNLCYKLFGGVYGYISDLKARGRQHVTGTLETRIPGIFWCNYFGKDYIEFFERNKLIEYPWHKFIEIDDTNIVAYLSQTPKEASVNIRLEENAKLYFGKYYFSLCKSDKPIGTIIKNIPKLNLPEIRNPII